MAVQQDAYTDLQMRALRGYCSEYRRALRAVWLCGLVLFSEDLPGVQKVRFMTKLKLKRLTDMKLLAGKTERICMTELRQRPGDVIDQVQMGKTFVITKQGKEVAVLSPPEPNALELGAEVRRSSLHK